MGRKTRTEREDKKVHRKKTQKKEEKKKEGRPRNSRGTERQQCSVEPISISKQWN
jgi:hypothetical protein